MAIIDATKALEIDEGNVKVRLSASNCKGSVAESRPRNQAFYRRAVANTAILRHNDALRDWKIVIKKNPSDKNAKIQFEQCNKTVKRDAFLKAIEVSDAPSAAEGLDLDNMTVEADYDGVKLEKEMTQEFIDDMIQRFKDGKKIHRKYVFQIILAVKQLVYEEPTMVEMEVGKDENLTVCGDTHGMYSIPAKLSHSRIGSACVADKISIISMSASLTQHQANSLISLKSSD